MKIKMDFVSNSSSTSFVYISKEMISQGDFLEAAGVDPESPAASLFITMFEQLNDSIRRGKRLTSDEEVDSVLASDDYTPEVIERMRRGIGDKKIVVAGEFSSEQNLAELLLCVEIFEIDSEKFFLNAYDNYW